MASKARTSTAKKVPKKGASAKASTAKAGSRGKGRPEVVVGRVTDWPLGARLVRLLGISDEATRIGCFQVVGEHSQAVSDKVFAVEETIPESLAPFEARMHAVLFTCAWSPGTSLDSHAAFHANLSPEELGAHLAGDYVVRTPAEALEARRRTPEESVALIEERLAKTSIGCPRKYLIEYLEGGALRDALLDVDAWALSNLAIAWPDAFNDVDRRLFRLWARRALDTDGPPMPPSAPELGFDRRGAHVDELVAIGVDEHAARAWSLRKRPLEHARWWTSTGVSAWERLASDPHKLVAQIAEANGEPRDTELAVAELLTSVLWLPEKALEVGALDVVRNACEDAALVSDGTLAKLRSNDDLAQLIAGIRRNPSATPRTIAANTRQPGPLLSAA